MFLKNYVDTNTGIGRNTGKAKQFTVDINSDDEADEGGDGETESATVQCVTFGIGVTRKSMIIG
jgi:hypothetical protein